MMQKIDQMKMDELNSTLSSSGPDALYNAMAQMGYQYAKLAEGVALGDSLSGSAAINFMQLTAKHAGKNIDQEQLQKIRHDMAQAYLKALAEQLRGGEGMVSRDINAQEAWDFHSAVFAKHNLDQDSWTLNSVFKALDSENRETYWDLVKSSAGSSLAEGDLAFQTHRMMALASVVGSQEVKQNADRWLARVEHPSTASAIAQMLAANIGKTLSDFSFNDLFGPSETIPEVQPPVIQPAPEPPPSGMGAHIDSNPPSVNLGASAGTHIPVHSSGARVDIGPLEFPNISADRDRCPKEYRHGDECDWDAAKGAADYLKK